MPPRLTKIIILTLGLTVAASADSAADGVPHREVADMLYELAFANRKVYTRDVVQRLTLEESVLTASEHYRDEKGLPLPAQMFRLSAEELFGNTDSFYLSLRSVDPINFANGAISPTEEQGCSSYWTIPPSVSTPRRQVSTVGEAWSRSMRTWRVSKRASRATTATPSRQGVTSNSVT